MQDVVDPVTDEMLAKFVVDSHFKSQPKGANMDDITLDESQEDIQASTSPVDPDVNTISYSVSHPVASELLSLSESHFGFPSFQILPQDLLKKYLTYAKLNVFPRLHDADLDKLSNVYAELRRESSVSFSHSCLC